MPFASWRLRIRCTAFYRDALGLGVRLESPHWSELELGGAVVALHGGGSAEATPTGLAFPVDDIKTACAASPRQPRAP